MTQSRESLGFFPITSVEGKSSIGYYDYSMNPNQPQKTNNINLSSSKEEFDSFEKETQEIKIVQEMTRKEQVVKIPNINPATEINYYKI